MVCAEWWAYQGLVILAGALGVLELASSIICLNLISMLYMIPMGIQESSTGLVGNCIGANNVPLAKSFFRIILSVTLTLLALTSVTTIFARNSVVLMFTDDTDLIEMATPPLIIVGFCSFIIGLQGFLQAPIRAMGL